jgi:hypothetical protein
VHPLLEVMLCEPEAAFASILVLQQTSTGLLSETCFIAWRRSLSLVSVSSLKAVVQAS